MFKILDGREYFYQWDTERKLIVEDASITEVHFSDTVDSVALVCEVYWDEAQTTRLVNVPNILLQTDWKINVYAFTEGHTKVSTTFKVAPRSKPADYVYTETEVKRWEDLEAKVEGALTADKIITELDIENTFEETEVYNANTVNGAVLAFAEMAISAEEKTNELEAQIEANKSLYANTLIADKTGELITINDASPLPHTKEIKTNGGNTSDYVYVYGKNLFDGKLTLDNNNVYARLELYLPAGKYVATFSNDIYLQSKSDTVTFTRNGNKVYFLTVATSGIVFLRFRMNESSSTKWDSNTKIQIEAGAVATEYEEYISSRNYRVDTSGNLPTSIELNEGNNTIYIMGNSGATITAKYSRDINKAFAELQQAIISLGGNI